MLKSKSGLSNATQISAAATTSSFDEDVESDGDLQLTEYCQKLGIANRARLMWMKTSFRKLNESFNSTGNSVGQAEKARFQATVRGLYDEILLDRKSNFTITQAAVSRCENLEHMLEAQQEHINNLELRLAHCQNSAHIEATDAKIRSLMTTIRQQAHEIAAIEDMKKSFPALQQQCDLLTAQNVLNLQKIASISSSLDETMHMLKHSDLQKAEVAKALERNTADLELQAQENRRLQIVLFSQRQQLAICIQQMAILRNDRSVPLPQALKSLTFDDGSEHEVLNGDQYERAQTYDVLLEDLFDSPNSRLQADP